jgi:hypothetical protein
VTREEFVASYAATANDFLTVRESARDYGSEKTAKSAANPTFMLAGTVAATSSAFGVTLQNVRETTAPRETTALVASADPVTPETIPLPRICRSAPIVEGLKITAVMSMVVTAGIMARVASS